MRSHLESTGLAVLTDKPVDVPAVQASSPGGLKYDGDKPVMALMPPKAMEEEGKVWTFGAKKYAYWNWTKGIQYVRILSAILRHTMALMSGQDLDPESGLHHAAHIRCCAGMLIEFHYRNRTDLDDRYKGDS